jgi:hypothetical protein
MCAHLVELNVLFFFTLFSQLEWAFKIKAEIQTNYSSETIKKTVDFRQFRVEKLFVGEVFAIPCTERIWGGKSFLFSEENRAQSKITLEALPPSP